MDTGSYISLNIGNPLCYILGGSLCYIVSGVAVLVVGVIITSVTFQNLDQHHEANKERYAGPILICAGILIMGKGAVFRIQKCECRTALKRKWNGFFRRLVREDSEAAAYLGHTDSDDGYSDDPPPYDAVAVNTGSVVTSRVQLNNSISSSLPSLPPYDEGVVNPGLDLSSETFPAPPPYEVVAIQPPSYSTGTEGRERPIRAIQQNIRCGRKKIRCPTRDTVQEVAQRLAQSMQVQEALMALTVIQPIQIQDDTDTELHDSSLSLTDSIEAHLEALERECLRESTPMHAENTASTLHSEQVRLVPQGSTIMISDNIRSSQPSNKQDTFRVDCDHQVSLNIQDFDRDQLLDESLSILIESEPGEASIGSGTQQNIETNVHSEMENQIE